jgi:hypothetical protein
VLHTIHTFGGNFLCLGVSALRKNAKISAIRQSFLEKRNGIFLVFLSQYPPSFYSIFKAQVWVSDHNAIIAKIATPGT